MGTQCQALKQLTLQAENEIRHITVTVNVTVLLHSLASVACCAGKRSHWMTTRLHTSPLIAKCCVAICHHAVGWGYVTVLLLVGNKNRWQAGSLFVTVFYSLGVTGTIKYHDISDQLLYQPRLSTSRSTRSYKKGRLVHHLALIPHKMDRSCQLESRETGCEKRQL